MKITLKWRGNEDGSQRYVVGLSVEDFRVEVLTPGTGDIPEISAKVSEGPTAPRDRVAAGADDVRGGRLSSVSINPEPLASTRIHAVRWVVVKADGEMAAASVFVIPRWEAIAAYVVTSAVTLVAVWWALDVYGALPHGHTLEAAAKVAGLPIAATIGLGFKGLVRPQAGWPPFGGVLHRIDRAALYALAMSAFMTLTNRRLATVHNDSDSPVLLSVGPLAPRDRIVVSSPPAAPNPAKYLMLPGDPNGPFADRLLEMLEPRSWTVTPIPFRVRASDLVEGCPRPTTGTCDVAATAGASIKLFADAIDEQRPRAGATQDGKPLAMLFLSLPWDRPADVPWDRATDWSLFLHARVDMPPRSFDSVRAFFALRQGGPELLELSVPAGGAASPLGVTPFPSSSRAVVATVDEAPDAPVLTKADQLGVIDSQAGGLLQCNGLDGNLVEITALDAVAATSVKGLEVTIPRPDGRDWRSSFIAHPSGAKHAWGCKPPAASTGVVTYRLSFAPDGVVRFWPTQGEVHYVMGDEGAGTCAQGKDIELRSYKVLRAAGEVVLTDANGAVLSTFRPAGSAFQQHAWLCVPAASAGVVTAAHVWLRATAGQGLGIHALGVNGSTIEFQDKPIPKPIF